jgi:hypothetical protein
MISDDKRIKHKEIHMIVYRVRYLLTWIQEPKGRYREVMWVSFSEDIENVSREFNANICLNFGLVNGDIEIIEIKPFATLVEKNNGKLEIKYDFA